MLRDHFPSGRRFVSTTVRGVERLVQALAFWTAAVLPIGYLPLLYMGSSSLTSVSLIGKLVSLNVVALLLGHGYRSDGDEE